MWHCAGKPHSWVRVERMRTRKVFNAGSFPGVRTAILLMHFGVLTPKPTRRQTMWVTCQHALTIPV
jgi:hypothetical protein